jgi:divalent metal cation (Fe/Co/Zn/Cd) transporter
VLTERAGLLRRALWLGWFTVIWNVAEGIVALVAAAAAGSQALLGFGVDSVVESLSAGVLIWRLVAERQQPERAEEVERRAVKLIGVTFFVLGAFVGFEALRALARGIEPESSVVGIVLTSVSLVVMPWLARQKREVAVAMGSKAVRTDGAQTMACAYLSAVVLGGLALNAALGWWWADPVAALVVVALLVREGWEALHAERINECCD